ncbi:MAG: hypothetical protein U0Q22_11425 [Acidimicrobiales bacterium]
MPTTELSESAAGPGRAGRATVTLAAVAAAAAVGVAVAPGAAATPYIPTDPLRQCQLSGKYACFGLQGEDMPADGNWRAALAPGGCTADADGSDNRSKITGTLASQAYRNDNSDWVTYGSQNVSMGTAGANLCNSGYNQWQRIYAPVDSKRVATRWPIRANATVGQACNPAGGDCVSIGNASFSITVVHP